MIIDHNHPMYRLKWYNAGNNKYNGAFYYSKEIKKHFIPNIETSRNWITVNIPNVGMSHSIVFIHNNLHPENYKHLEKYEDLILVCGIKSTMKKVKHLGKTIYLPLSIDTEYVSKFKCEKTKETAFIGRLAKGVGYNFGDDVDIISGMPRGELLPIMAQYKKVYAVGLTAIEAKCLGAEILPYDPRYPKDIWDVIDIRDAAKMLKRKLNRIDKPKSK